MRGVNFHDRVSNIVYSLDSINGGLPTLEEIVIEGILNGFGSTG